MSKGWGRYEFKGWVVRPSLSNKLGENELLSFHEKAHAELDEISGYGALLRAYDLLGEYGIKDKDHYRKLHNDLLNQSALVHEIFATWISISSLQKDHSDKTIEKLLDDNLEYQFYYSWGKSLVGEIPSRDLQSIIILVCCSFCLQSSTIFSYVLEDKENFHLGLVSAADYPDKRFKSLHSNFNSSFFIDLTEAYISNLTDQAERDVFREIFSRDGLAIDKFSVETVHQYESFCFYIEEQLNNFFLERNCISFIKNGHLSHVSKFLTSIAEECPDSPDKFFFPIDPYDYDRLLMHNMEMETLLFSDKKEKVKIVSYSDLENTTEKKELVGDIMRARNAVVLAWTTQMLIDQFELTKDQTDYYKKTGEHPITFIQYRKLREEGNTIITLVTFSNKEQLLSFFQEFSIEVAFYSCISAMLLDYDEWQKEWLSFFDEYCQSDFVFNDISAFFVVDRYLTNMTEVSFNIICDWNFGEQYQIVTFEYLDGNGFKWKMFSFCSGLYASLLEYYIKKYKGDVFILNEDLSDNDLSDYKLIGSTLVNFLHQFYYHSGGIVHHYNA